MRIAVLALALALAACGQTGAPPPPLPEQTAAAAPWLICDATDAPVLLVFEREGDVARMTEYEKPSGALARRADYRIGEEEGAVGSVHVALLQDGADVGAVSRLNPGMLDAPASAYTPPFSSVRIGERRISCRWLPRTRLMGFTGRRTIIVSEDGDGDLIYTSYDFAAAAEAPQVELGENGQTTTFSLEVRNGAETVSAEATRFVFQADAETEIAVIVPRDGIGRVAVRRHGPEPVQVEELLAFVQGAGAE